MRSTPSILWCAGLHLEARPHAEGWLASPMPMAVHSDGIAFAHRQVTAAQCDARPNQTVTNGWTVERLRRSWPPTAAQHCGQTLCFVLQAGAVRLAGACTQALRCCEQALKCEPYHQTLCCQQALRGCWALYSGVVLLQAGTVQQPLMLT